MAGRVERNAGRDKAALAKATTVQGDKSIMSGAFSPEEKRAMGQTWSKLTLRFMKLSNDTAVVYAGPEMKPMRLVFVRTKNGWKLDKWTPGK